MAHRKIFRSRPLIYNSKDETWTIDVTFCAAQVSILGLDLWNVAYDSLLRSKIPEETVWTGYANDLIDLITARKVEMAQLKLNQDMRLVSVCVPDHGL